MCSGCHKALSRFYTVFTVFEDFFIQVVIFVFSETEDRNVLAKESVATSITPTNKRKSYNVFHNTSAVSSSASPEAFERRESFENISTHEASLSPSER